MGAVVHVSSEAEGSGLRTELGGRDWNMGQIRIRTQICLWRDEQLGHTHTVKGGDATRTPHQGGEVQIMRGWLMCMIATVFILLKGDRVFASCPIWSCIDAVP